LQANERQLHNLLAVLSGRTAIEDLGQETLPEIIPLPSTGVPADLLAARPDIQAAGLRLQSTDWVVSAARADRLPNLTISSRAAFSSGHLDLLFDNWIMSLAGSIAGPLFDAGQRSAEVDRTRAVAEEALADYARTVSEAIREVEDNLEAEMRQQEYIALLGDQLDATRVTLKDARLQYQNGQSNYLAYLTAWNSVQSLERQMAEETAARIKYRVALYRALGKHWTVPDDGAMGS
jgi:outer membrane protein TolC